MYNYLFLLYGLLIGSFLNVCIYRLPNNETIVRGRSHCQNCGTTIRWYDLMPVISYILLRGQCRKCKTKISMQYPLVELLNSVAYLWIYNLYGISLLTILYCILVSTLIVLSFIDIKTMTIPISTNIIILSLGIVRIISDYRNWSLYIIGFFAVSLLLYLVAVVTGGMGGGDIKLMAAAGLLLGWKLIIVALVLGCIIGSVIQIILILMKKGSRTLPFGPYLSIGIYIAALYGNQLINWYISTFFRF